jgi:hypothetical protein
MSLRNQSNKSNTLAIWKIPKDEQIPKWKIAPESVQLEPKDVSHIIPPGPLLAAEAVSVRNCLLLHSWDMATS